MIVVKRDIIDMYLDLDRKVLSFVVNGISRGIASNIDNKHDYLMEVLLNDEDTEIGLISSCTQLLSIPCKWYFVNENVSSSIIYSVP